MTLKDLLKNDFGADLPISGGFGNSIDNPIIIHRNGINDYVGTEVTSQGNNLKNRLNSEKVCIFSDDLRRTQSNI
jgi:hypothetical protein